MDHLCHLCFVFVMLSHPSLLPGVTCWEKAGLLALVFAVQVCFVTRITNTRVYNLHIRQPAHLER